jgi:hypothetical protein
MRWNSAAVSSAALALNLLGEAHNLLYGSAITLHGLILLDMNKASTALNCFCTALEIKKLLLNPDDALIASCYNNISLAYTENSDLGKAI